MHRSLMEMWGRHFNWYIFDHIRRDCAHQYPLHVYAICCRPEVASDVISGENAKTIEGYAVLNFEIASLSSF